MTQFEIIPSLRDLCIIYAERENGILPLIYDGLIECLPSILSLPVGKRYYFAIHPYGFEGSHKLSFLNERLENVVCDDKHIYDVTHLSPNEFYISLY